MSTPSTPIRSPKAKGKNQPSASASTSSPTAVPRKKPRRRPVTHALRNIRIQQKSTLLSFRYSPLRDLVREIAADLSEKTWLRPTTVKTIQGIVESALVGLLEKAYRHRLANFSAVEMKRQSAPTLLGRNLEAAIKDFDDYRSWPLEECIRENEHLLPVLPVAGKKA